MQFKTNGISFLLFYLQFPAWPVDKFKKTHIFSAIKIHNLINRRGTIAKTTL